MRSIERVEHGLLRVRGHDAHRERQRGHRLRARVRLRRRVVERGVERVRRGRRERAVLGRVIRLAELGGHLRQLVGDHVQPVRAGGLGGGRRVTRDPVLQAADEQPVRADLPAHVGEVGLHRRPVLAHRARVAVGLPQRVRRDDERAAPVDVVAVAAAEDRELRRGARDQPVRQLGLEHVALHPAQVARHVELRVDRAHRLDHVRQPRELLAMRAVRERRLHVRADRPLRHPVDGVDQVVVGRDRAARGHVGVGGQTGDRGVVDDVVVGEAADLDVLEAVVHRGRRERLLGRAARRVRVEDAGRGARRGRAHRAAGGP